MSVDPTGRPNVPLSIGGQTFNLLVDTGGVDSMLSDKTVEALGLPKMPLQYAYVVMFGGLKIDHNTIARDIDFGGLKAEKMPFLVTPAPMSDGVSGILSNDVLRVYDVEFDFANARFNLFLQDHCQADLAYWTTDDHAEIPFTLSNIGHIEFLVELDGQSIRAVLDTGAFRSTLQLEQAEDIFSFKDDDPALKTIAKSSRGNVSKYPFKTLKFGGVAVSNPDILLFPRREIALPGRPELILGMDVLRQLHLYIAYKEKKLYVTAASAH
jgi:predicted aspartyl protease